jgi:hypothetical protein
LIIQIFPLPVQKKDETPSNPYEYVSSPFSNFYNYPQFPLTHFSPSPNLPHPHPTV